MTQEPLVIILVLNWNNQKATVDCLTSLQRIDYPRYEIVVIDNGSIDNSPVEIQRKFPHVRLIRNQTNLGYAGGNNVGIRYALSNNADYILILNNDTVVKHDFLKHLLQTMRSAASAGIVGAKTYLMNTENTLFSARCCFIRVLGQPYLEGFNQTDHGQFDRDRPADCVSGSCMLVKRDVFEKIGLLNEDYFIYLEDVELSLRARQQGFQCMYSHQSVIWHEFSGTFGYQSPRYLYYLNRNRCMIARSQNHFMVFVLIFLPYFILKKLLFESIRWLLKAKIPQTAAIYRSFLDYWLGIKGKVTYFD